MGYKKKVDANQNAIVSLLRLINGVSVEPDHDDILVGYNGVTYWFELKNPNVANKSGKVFESAKKKSQKKILARFCGHYKIVTTLIEILQEIGIEMDEITIIRKCKKLCMPEPLCMPLFENKKTSTKKQKEDAFKFVTTTRLGECKIGFK